MYLYPLDNRDLAAQLLHRGEVEVDFLIDQMVALKVKNTDEGDLEY